MKKIPAVTSGFIAMYFAVIGIFATGDPVQPRASPKVAPSADMKQYDCRFEPSGLLGYEEKGWRLTCPDVTSPLYRPLNMPQQFFGYDLEVYGDNLFVYGKFLTNLMFSEVTTAAGFDTGLAIAEEMLLVYVLYLGPQPPSEQVAPPAEQLLIADADDRRQRPFTLSLVRVG